MSTTRTTSPYDIQIRRANLRTERQGLYITDIRASIIELSIYESIDKLTISGYITIVDNDNIYSQVDFQGTEKLELELLLPDSPFKSFKKTFIIHKVANTNKGNDQTEVITLDFVDIDGYIDVLSNVNKAYDGTIDTIISKILADNFEKPRALRVSSDVRQKEMRVIIPNWRPYTAIQWLAERATSSLGLPFFAFTTLLDNRVRFLSLQDMLETPSSNPLSYKYNQGAANDTEKTFLAQAYNISSFQQKNTEDSLKIAHEGGISGKYQFIDTNNFTVNGINYRVDQIFDKLGDQANIVQGQNTPNYDPFFEVHRGKLHEYGTTQVTQISASAVYSDVPSYHEDLNAADHSTKAISYSMRQFLRKSEMQVMIPGRNFFPNEQGYNGIGQTIDIEFLDNAPKADNRTAADNTPDFKRSGKYLIHSTRHLIRNTNQQVRYDTVNNVVKLANRKGST